MDLARRWLLIVLALPGAPLRAHAQERAASSGVELATLALEDVPLRTAGGATVTAQRGKLRVPIVRAKRDSKPIEVDVWRFRALASAPRGAPPIFRLNGGPGWPGLEPGEVDYDGDLAPFLACADVVLVGQRGIGTSTDTSCAAVLAGTEPPAHDAPADELAAFVRARCAECRAHWEARGYDLSGLNVREAAADVDDVRRLLGYERIALWGGSFGSHWGMAVMRYHPESVARAVLTGMEGPDHTYDSPSGVLRALERIAAAAERAPELAGRIPEEGLLGALAVVIESLDAEPVELEVAHPRTNAPTLVRLDGDAVRALARGVGARVSSRGAMPRWPAEILALYRGEFERAARAHLADAELDLPSAAFFGLDCGSGITRARHDALRADPAARLVGDLNWFYDVACPAWDADLGDDFRTGFRTSIPTVIVQGTWDVNTPFENALELLPSFEHAHFVPVEGGSHDALNEAIRHDPAFGEALLAFLATGAGDGLPAGVVLPDVEWVVPD